MSKTYIASLLVAIIFFGCAEQQINKAPLGEQITMNTPRDKIWAHRVNSLVDLEERLSEFKGIEVDIFYNTETHSFDVKHSEHLPSLDLEYFLDSVRRVKQVCYWFDYKNLNEETDQGISKLCSILKDRKLEQASFVESYYGSSLERFDGELATSFWVSLAEIPKEKEKRDRLYEESYAPIQKLNVSMLSASFEMFEFLEMYFPTWKCNYWMSVPLTDEKIAALKKMADSENVNVILVDGTKNPVQ